MLGLAGFYSAFFFTTMYMQEILHLCPLRGGAAYVPAGGIVFISSIGGSGLVPPLAPAP